MAYKLLAVEGSGAYGTVVKARDLSRDRMIVALKVLREDHLDNPRVLCRTRDEARMLTALDHPNIVKVYDLDERYGRPVMVMEWLEAYSLGDLIDHIGSGFPIEVACELIATAADALDHAWTQRTGDPPRPMRLVHRDLKPNNMLLSINGRLKLVDFGLAHGDFDGKESHTVSMVLGTRAYMAPERLDGAEDAPSADVYALGLILFELLIGRPMSLSLNPRHHTVRLQEKLQQLDLSALPRSADARLRKLIVALLEYEPEDRPTHLETAQELQTVMAMASLSPNVHAFARRYVKPLVTAKRAAPPSEHPDYADIAFVEKRPEPLDLRAKTHVDPDASAANDDLLRKLLVGDRWMNHLPRVKRILSEGEYTPAPFLEVMDAALQAQWSGNAPDARKIALCLNLLRSRPTPDVIQRAAALSTYDDDLVRRTAEQFLDAIR